MPRAPGQSFLILRVLLGLLLVAAAVPLGAYGFVELRALPKLRTLDSAPKAPVALVFGAGLLRDGKVSGVLRKRLDTAIALYRAGKVDKLLLSGNSDRHHDEVRAMRRYALDQGVPEEALQGDEEGLSTFDSCLRAREVFGITEATLVTQRFHLPRALFIAEAEGIHVTGVAADPLSQGAATFSARELLARPLAILYVLTNPRPH